MKNNTFISILLSAFIAFLFISSLSLAQEPPHPPTIGHGQHGNQAPGGTAPVGSGLDTLLILAAGYGSIRMNRSAKDQKDPS